MLADLVGFDPARKGSAQVCLWLQADMEPPEFEVRFAPKTGHSSADVRFRADFVRSSLRSGHFHGLV